MIPRLRLACVLCVVILLSGMLTPLWGQAAGERRVLTLCGIEFPFRYCPDGSFIMGSPEEEQGRNSGETRHKVVFSEGFWILETEVTQKMYQAVMGVNPSEFRGDTLPVDSVSWYDAVKFCDHLTKAANTNGGMSFQLPTEAQWEYACRAGSNAPWFGNLDEIAWFGESTDSGMTHTVGTKKPNAWGIFDMHGNLWEWCFDLYADFDTQEVRDPTGPKQASGTVRIDRGGCWDSTPDYCRAAHRGVYEPDRKSRFVGFRITGK